jgi:hypothetical protein
MKMSSQPEWARLAGIDWLNKAIKASPCPDPASSRARRAGILGRSAERRPRSCVRDFRRDVSESSLVPASGPTEIRERRPTKLDRLLWPEGHMGGAPLVIALVGLVFPTLMLLAALVFDVVLTAWTVFRWWHERHPRALAQ